MNNELVNLDVDEQTKTNILFLIMKRLTDITIGLIGTIFLVPVSLVIKLALIITKDKGPLFFKQKRVGRYGKEIYIYKFRSMIVGAEDVLKDLMSKDPKIKKEYETNKKLANDPRITKVGKFIRKTCIDEMPQFLNLLKGDMSLIGPRPYLFGEVKDIGDSFDSIVSVKPGITGLWQVSEKSDMSFKRRCVIDKYYANNLNLRLDIKIFFKTFSTIIFNKGTK